MTIYTTYSTFLKVGGDFKAEVAKMLGKKQHLPVDVIDRLADVHASRYGVQRRMTAGGRSTFYKDGKRETTSTRAWERWVGCFDPRAKDARGGATSKQVDPVEKLFGAYNALTAAQKRRFKALI